MQAARKNSCAALRDICFHLPSDSEQRYSRSMLKYGSEEQTNVLSLQTVRSAVIHQRLELRHLLGPFSLIKYQGHGSSCVYLNEIFVDVVELYVLNSKAQYRHLQKLRAKLKS